MRLKVDVTGIVQGVGFRPFVYRIAVLNSLNGYVRNRGDAGVEIVIEGSEQRVKDFLADLSEKKPPMAKIYTIMTSNLEEKSAFAAFNIIRSSEEAKNSGSVIPPDVAICEECLAELRDPEDPRYGYFFITCTNCGPRFTIIERLPYDRENTTMREFPLCNYCLREFNDPLNRRFHAQTVACPECGPKTYLTTRSGGNIRTTDPVREAGRLISEGFIVAVKGYGGFHIAASATEEKPLSRLRRIKHRRAKPFAVMARSLEATEFFAEVNSKERELLSSYTRPILLLNKKQHFSLSKLVAPELHNIGVMLPYSGLHYMLFDKVHDSAFVMTSANPPNQPIVKEDKEALRTLSGTADYFLFHNRQIAHRCDDSVARVHGNRMAFLRRSRGYSPVPVILKEKAKTCVMGLGGELNNVPCILFEDRAFLGQHIGDVENLETRTFLQEAANHLIRLTNTHVSTITCDLHPKFNTTDLARELATQNDWSLIEVQHHHAHVAGLIMEHAVDEMVGIVCDGYGYGTDGSAWGGEILYCTRDSPKFKRVGHLESQPQVGGDSATRYPLRMAAGILNKRIDISPWLIEKSNHLPHGEAEATIILQQLRHQNSLLETTSCGRVLDAVAAILGICYERTYEGEPAMKLESVAFSGKDALGLKPKIKGGALDTTELLMAVFENKQNVTLRNLSYSAHAYIANGLASMAIDAASERNVKNVGFTGGVACNEILARIMRYTVEEAGFKFFVHEAVPSGDGGVSFGQAVVGAFSSF